MLKYDYCEKERQLKNEFDNERRNLIKQNADACALIQEKSIENNLKYQSRIESLTTVINIFFIFKSMQINFY
jgi:hypothetical protein